jgi:hypothetical protein
MKYQRPILLPLSLVTSMVLVALLFYPAGPVTSQTPNKNLNPSIGRPSRQAIQLPPRPAPTPTPESSTEVVKVDVDLVKIDALVLQKNTARIVGGLKNDNLAFVASNKKRDGTTRKLKLDIDPARQKSQGKLVIKARRSYISPRS